MEATKIKNMQGYCDRLTKDGEELSVTWEGGNDSGWFNLLLNGREIEPITIVRQDILRFIEEELGYGSFAGDFSTDGRIVYNRVDKCFVGEDTYSETDQATQQCNIEFKIPEEVWFDQIIINVSSDGDDCNIDALVAIQVNNGPHPETFDHIKEQLESMLKETYTGLIENIEEFAGIWEDFTIPRKDFQSKNGVLQHVINSFDYTYSKSSIAEICIPFE